MERCRTNGNHHTGLTDVYPKNLTFAPKGLKNPVFDSVLTKKVPKVVLLAAMTSLVDLSKPPPTGKTTFLLYKNTDKCYNVPTFM